MIIYILALALLASTITLSVLLVKRTKDMNYWKQCFNEELVSVQNDFDEFKRELLIKLPRINAEKHELAEADYENNNE